MSKETATAVAAPGHGPDHAVDGTNGLRRWTVQLTLTTAGRVDEATAAAIRGQAGEGTAGCRPGGCGVSVALGVQAATVTGAYAAAVARLVSEVLPLLPGPALIDVRITADPPPVRVSC